MIVVFFVGWLETTLSLLAGFAAGGFLSVVVRDLLPHAFESIKVSRTWLPHIVAAIIGISLMLAVTNLVPHKETAFPASRSSLIAYTV